MYCSEQHSKAICWESEYGEYCRNETLKNISTKLFQSPAKGDNQYQISEVFTVLENKALENNY